MTRCRLVGGPSDGEWREVRAGLKDLQVIKRSEIMRMVDLRDGGQSMPSHDAVSYIEEVFKWRDTNGDVQSLRMFRYSEMTTDDMVKRVFNEWGPRRDQDDVS
jgi:hypothetical protein